MEEQKTPKVKIASIKITNDQKSALWTAVIDLYQVSNMMSEIKGYTPENIQRKHNALFTINNLMDDLKSIESNIPIMNVKGTMTYQYKFTHEEKTIIINQNCRHNTSEIEARININIG